MRKHHDNPAFNIGMLFLYNIGIMSGTLDFWDNPLFFGVLLILICPAIVICLLNLNRIFKRVDLKPEHEYIYNNRGEIVG